MINKNQPVNADPSPEIIFDNVVHDEEINTRNLIIRGHIENVATYDDFVFVLIDGIVYPWPIENGHFRGLVQLTSRHNNIYFQYGQHVNTTLHLHYISLADIPSLKIAVFYCKDSALKPPFTELIHPNDTRNTQEIKRDIQDKISIGVQLIQSLIGEINYIHRENRQSFNLESNATIKHSLDFVKVHFVPLDYTIQELAKLCRNHSSNPGNSYSEFAPFIKALQSYGYPFDSNQLVLGFLLDPFINLESEQDNCEMNSVLNTPHFKLGVYSCSTIFSWPSNLQIYEHLSRLTIVELAVDHDYDYKTYDLGELWDYSLSKLYHLMLSLFNLKSKTELEEGFGEEDLILKAFIQKPFDNNNQVFTPNAYLGSLMFPKFKSIEFAYHPAARAHEEYLNPDYHLTATPSIYVGTNGLLVVSGTKIIAIRAEIGAQECYLPFQHVPMQPLHISSYIWSALEVKQPVNLYIHTTTGACTFIPDVASFISTNLVDIYDNVQYYRSPSPLAEKSLEKVTSFDIKFYLMSNCKFHITVYGNELVITGIKVRIMNEISVYGVCNQQLGLEQTFDNANFLTGMNLYQGPRGLVGIEFLSENKNSAFIGNKKGHLILCRPPPDSQIVGIHGQFSPKALLSLGIINPASHFDTTQPIVGQKLHFIT